MKESLDPTVATALAESGLAVRGFALLSRHRLPAINRIAYRIDLSPHGTVKARRLEDDATAKRLHENRCEQPSAFAPVRERRGSVLIEEWIDGESVEERPEPSAVTQAAILLAELHGRRTVTGQVVHHAHNTIALRAGITERLRHVQAAGVLNERDAALVDQALDRLDPRQAVHGLVHLDFCGENMVLDRDRRLHVIDNERLGIDALGFDLGRARYRWALRPAEWELFRSVYASHLPVALPREGEDFWALVALVYSTALRLRAYPDRVQAPAEQLHAHVARLREEMQ